MKVSELDDLLVRLITESDHPEISGVHVVPTKDQPDNPTRIRVDFASGASAYVMVAKVNGSGVAKHERYEIPTGMV